MDIRWVKTFVMAAELENYRMAAEKLFLAQPTITMHVQHLEKELGAALFEKKGRNIHLTKAGHRFLPHAKQLMLTFTEGVADLKKWQQGYSGKLVLSVSPLVAASMLPFILHRFMKAHPAIEVVIQVKESVEIGQAVSKGTADLGLTRMEPVQPDVISSILYKDPVIPVIAHDGKEPDFPLPDPHDILESETLFTNNHPVYWEDLLSAVKHINPGIRTMVVSQVDVTKRFVEEGLGFSFLPRSSVRRELLEGRLLEIDMPFLPMPIASTYLCSKYETEESVLFSTFLREFY